MYRVVFPFELKLCNTSEGCDAADSLYNLFAVVVHIGSGMNHGKPCLAPVMLCSTCHNETADLAMHSFRCDWLRSEAYCLVQCGCMDTIGCVLASYEALYHVRVHTIQHHWTAIVNRLHALCRALCSFGQEP